MIDEIIVRQEQQRSTSTKLKRQLSQNKLLPMIIILQSKESSLGFLSPTFHFSLLLPDIEQTFVNFR